MKNLFSATAHELSEMIEMRLLATTFLALVVLFFVVRGLAHEGAISRFSPASIQDARP